MFSLISCDASSSCCPALRSWPSIWDLDSGFFQSSQDLMETLIFFARKDGQFGRLYVLKTSVIASLRVECRSSLCSKPFCAFTDGMVTFIEFSISGCPVFKPVCVQCEFEAAGA